MTDATGSAPVDEPDRAAEAVAVRDVPAEQRFEIRVDGELAGFAEYRRAPGDVRAFPHTQVGPAYQGRGLAQRLVRDALDQTRGAQLSVLPYCPVVRGFIARHPDYLDLVAPDRRAEFDLA